MKQEVHREECNVFIGNQLQEETETIVYYNDNTFEILTPETTLEDEEEDE